MTPNSLIAQAMSCVAVASASQAAEYIAEPDSNKLTGVLFEALMTLQPSEILRHFRRGVEGTSSWAFATFSDPGWNERVLILTDFEDWIGRDTWMNICLGKFTARVTAVRSQVDPPGLSIVINDPGHVEGLFQKLDQLAMTQKLRGA